jgi:hypothetical protein
VFLFPTDRASVDKLSGFHYAAARLLKYRACPGGRLW